MMSYLKIRPSVGDPSYALLQNQCLWLHNSCHYNFQLTETVKSLRTEIMFQLSLYCKPLLIHSLACYAELNEMKYLIKNIVGSAVEKVASNDLHYSQARA